MSRNLIATTCAFFVLGLSACNQTTSTVKEKDNAVVDSLFPAASKFKTAIDQKDVNLYYLKNNKGALAAITNYGARLVGLAVPDKNGKLVDWLYAKEQTAQSMLKILGY